jgi:lipopolysaccharide/colanic/teichoic acid biosynthesis glycosyltransferase
MLLAVAFIDWFSMRFAMAELHGLIVLSFCFSWLIIYGNNDFKLDYYTLALRTSLLAATFMILYLLVEQQKRLAVMTLSVFFLWLMLAHISRFYLTHLGGPRFKVLLPVNGKLRSFKSDRRMQYDYQSSPDHLKLHHYDLIVINTEAHYSESWRKFIAYARGKGVPVLSETEFYEEQFAKISLECFQHPWLEHSFSVNWLYMKGRRLADIVMTITAAPILLIVSLVVGVAIRISMGGPVFFTQQRMGQHNQIFRMYKFRSMRPMKASDTAHCPERITPLGHFLRRYRLDELPQFLNILQGNMTLIGPRPDSVELAEQYSREIPVYNMRHLVKPGLTGWAQVSQGHICSVEDTIEKLQYDLFYIKNFAFWLDFKIVLKTIFTLLTGFGAR